MKGEMCGGSVRRHFSQDFILILHPPTRHHPPTLLTHPLTSSQPRLQTCVCSIAEDYSVTILSLSERKCLLLAGSHSSPVDCVRWRLEEDFLLVSCVDGKLYVWQIETGEGRREGEGRGGGDRGKVEKGEGEGEGEGGVGGRGREEKWERKEGKGEGGKGRGKGNGSGRGG